ncbi:ABC transporter ATP-binding protein [Peribacillus cavernae]|uniref:ABC transporter ATP-binding protein n=1 Tax=Peribacillus cavernae TaxID=1674310 RepID=A0A3S0WAX5_9BACI|nr:ABC transporter ATP-binding protein [Peribacillus cavernae]MDQ0218603.1 oligopeptide/dipeptide ABC transporter ATP-binding protein [Peribacillus cavernae]RUQ31588.1 ABC transporter ATP-binding protein [Peribacillus cavernae]
MNAVDPLLQIEDLKTYFYSGDKVIPSVDGVSFHINKGEIVALVGESGCGKSVTSLSILGLIDSPGKIEGGRILYHDLDLTRLSQKEKLQIRGKEISIIFQEPLAALNPVFTVGYQIQENIMVHERISKKKAKAKAIDLLIKVGIPHPEKVYQNYPHSLSGGMRQRVMIAMALSGNPKLIIADEPTTALDVTIQAQILQLLKEITEQQRTSILFITHDLGVVAEIADRVIVMYAGQVVEQADVYSLFDNPKHPYTKALFNSSPKMDQIDEELTAIEGAVPSPFEKPMGCKFHTRCPYVMGKCKSISPDLEENNGHLVRCWLSTENAKSEVT